ncbi:MAG: helix-turn-helix domain-containing protein [Armatimonadetes bacterium]|nr:helix-turn-helix domain-containing protein [Armatimonadota bacterium]
MTATVSGHKLLKPAEAMETLRLSRAGFYQLARRGAIPTVRVGRLMFVPSGWVDKKLGEWEEEAA